MYVVYGFTHKDYVLMASYAVIWSLVLALIGLKYRYHVIRFPKGDDEDRRITTTHDALEVPSGTSKHGYDGASTRGGG